MHRLARGVGALTTCLFLLPCAAVAVLQQNNTAMNSRGDHVMGFDQGKTTHHFTLTKTGGIIQVQANDSSDVASRDHIRMHSQHISKAFAQGEIIATLAIWSKRG